uniref:(northern house mosquito) hypothetical protein n=1 Tax=Culex pipiens TaxID=7175 RepID=A0A8D8ASC3_CULPI
MRPKKGQGEAAVVRFIFLSSFVVGVVSAAFMLSFCFSAHVFSAQPLCWLMFMFSGSPPSDFQRRSERADEFLRVFVPPPHTHTCACTQDVHTGIPYTQVRFRKKE